MTEWKVQLHDTGAPKFASLVDCIERDIASGALAPGAQLPPYRDLAQSLGVSPGTVSKAYVEAKKRGLVDGEVGRGTFVRMNTTPSASAAPLTIDAQSAEDAAPGLIDISINTPPMLSHNLILADAFASLSRQTDLDLQSRYLPYFVHPQHREAAASWLTQHGLAVGGDDVVFTNGAQHAMTVAFATIAERGDVIFTDALTYPGMLALGKHLGMTLEGIEADEQGMIPERLEKALRRKPGKAVYLMPTLQNPYGTSLSLERRKAIAAIAERHGLFIIEDDIYGLLSPSDVPTIKSLLPESTFYLTSMSKAVIPSLRVGFLVPPKRKIADVTASMRATGWTAAPLMVDVGAKLILDGTAQRMAEQNREEAHRRQEVAHKVLGKWLRGPVALSYHAWLDLPGEWETEQFIWSARMSGVLLTPSDGLRVGTTDPRGVRLCLGAPRTPQILETALRRLEAILLGGAKQTFTGLI
ncbi:PLP-dependent aminotransferase family protein [Cupriavidus plantarum]|uniref:aminotransferase-like domain-containing protein n=1 Tax=Cupriavidus plantarum TaxID=942865 RepID=UPI0015C88B63|nr:PLP-dependent aminotransferase family protein [Cupriavidus plantarum]NYI02758.1 DNA-binding transcriptional MocR family regulator [Cupriavidus plantarum]